MKKILLSAAALLCAAASVQAQDYLFSEAAENTYAITMTADEIEAVKATNAQWGNELGAGNVTFPDGYVLFENDKLTITSVQTSYVWTSGGKMTQIKEENPTYTGYVNFGSILKDNNWASELPVIYFINEQWTAWQSILAVTPKVDGKLGFGVYAGDNTRSIGIYNLATEAELEKEFYGEWVDYTDFRNDGENGTVKNAPAFTEGEVKAGRTYGLLGGGKKNLNLHRITFVPSAEGTGIAGVETSSDKIVEACYTLDGVRLAAPVKGVNIVRYSDGTSVKVVK